MPNQNQVKYVPAGTGPMYWGPGDRVSFLATGADSHGSCFIFEGLTVPGGGPPPHIHRFEDESFYILEGTATFQVGGQTIYAKPGDFIHIPQGTVHSVKNEGKSSGTVRSIIRSGEKPDLSPGLPFTPGSPANSGSANTGRKTWSFICGTVLEPLSLRSANGMTSRR